MDPSASFEDEILSINPDYDLIFSKRDEARLNLSPQPIEGRRRKFSPSKMKIISKMNQIIGGKPIGELSTQNDWEDTECTEKETIALMRTLGLEPSIDRAPDEKRTISSVPTNDVIFMRNGHKKMSIFMSDTYFELKPRSEPSFGSDEVDTSTASSEYSSDVNMYEPIPMDLSTSNDTTTTTLSEDDSPKKLPDKCDRPKANQNLNSKLTLDSSQSQAAEDNIELSWRSRGPVPEVSHQAKNKRNPESSWYNRTGKSSGNSWRRSNESSSHTVDESNWRVSLNKPTDTENKDEAVKRNQIKSETISNCGSQLFKPKDLFLKKKAMLIQKVLADNQS